MAVYKIPQDVEADDKFVGPLSFKQFIYCGIAGIGAYLSFLSLTKGFWPVLFLLVPIIIVAGFLGFPWGRDQPTEVWLAARIRFFLKPRVRIWNQSGIKDLVTITVPKHIERHLTNGLSQNEVSSRLTGLADLLDSRGWAVKNVNVNMYASPVVSTSAYDSDDRLLNVASLPQEVVDVTANDDVLDEANNPTAQHFEEMIRLSEQKHREQVMSQLQSAREPDTKLPTEPAGQGGADFWFLQQGGHNNKQHAAAKDIFQEATPTPGDIPDPGFTTFRAPDVVAPHTSAPTVSAPETAIANQLVSQQDEQALLAKIHKAHEASNNPFGHIKTINPLGQTPSVPVAPPVTPASASQNPAVPQSVQPQPMQPPVPVTPPVNPAIINLANNDDLNVETIARQADKSTELRPSDDEVVISLH